MAMRIAKMRVPVLAAGLVAALSMASHAMAAETWLECAGTVVTTGTDADGKALNDSQPSKQVLAYDDATKKLFRYSDKRKQLDPMFTTAYSPEQIKWGDAEQASPSGAWEGTLDRAKMAVTIVRKQRGTVMTWNETCKPTKPF